MSVAVGKISSKSVSGSSFRLSTKNAWAKYVRNRWHANVLAEIQAEWDLTEGEARGVLYAQASQSTIDKILEHRRGGFGLGLEILALKCATTLEGFIENQAQEAVRERARWQAEERRLAALHRRVSERCEFARPRADARRSDRPGASGMG